MKTICITGGPGSGKTIIFNHLARTLEARGYHIFLIPDVTEYLIQYGIEPTEHLSEIAFLNFVLKMQLQQEDLYSNLTKYYPSEKVIVFTTRGIMDIATKVPYSVFDGMLQMHGLKIDDVYKHYDAVLHLVTAADGAEEFYQYIDPTVTQGISSLSSHTPEEAKKQDLMTQQAWEGHPNHYIIHSTASFSEKVKASMHAVFGLLHEPLPNNTKKYVIKKPGQLFLNSIGGKMHKTSIIQTYLLGPSSLVDRRIMQRGSKENGFKYYYIEKVTLNKDLNEQYVTETPIDKQAYRNLMTEADPQIPSSARTRYSFVWNDKYFEIDLYPFDHDYAILELDSDLNPDGNLPPFEIINEITNNQDYSSRILAQSKRLPVIERKSMRKTAKWTYEVGREEKDFGRNDARFYDVVTTEDEAEALSSLKENGRNYLIRYRDLNGIHELQWYDTTTHIWVSA